MTTVVTRSSVSIHETPTISDIPVIQVTDPTDQLANNSINNIGHLFNNININKQCINMLISLIMFYRDGEESDA